MAHLTNESAPPHAALDALLPLAERAISSPHPKGGDVERWLHKVLEKYKLIVKGDTPLNRLASLRSVDTAMHNEEVSNHLRWCASHLREYFAPLLIPEGDLLVEWQGTVEPLPEQPLSTLVRSVFGTGTNRMESDVEHYWLPLLQQAAKHPEGASYKLVRLSPQDAANHEQLLAERNLEPAGLRELCAFAAQWSWGTFKRSPRHEMERVVAVGDKLAGRYCAATHGITRKFEGRCLSFSGKSNDLNEYGRILGTVAPEDFWEHLILVRSAE